MNKPEYIIWHTVGLDRVVEIPEIDQWHKARGFAGFGYHYYIRFDGTRETGRPENKEGAHCKNMGMNRKSIGVCVEGDGDKKDWTPEQRAEAFLLAEELFNKYRIPSARNMGHRETGAPKTCPGNKVNMARFRNELEARIVKVDTDIAIGKID